MNILNKKEHVLLLIGDISLFLISLWLTLLIRYGNFPDWPLFERHLEAFGVLFLLWIGVFFIVGLYERHTVVLKKNLPGLLFNAQIANCAIAVLFFYFIPYAGLTPKVNLFLYLAVSFVLVLAWRIYGLRLFVAKRKQNALIIGAGQEMKELRDEINNNTRYNIRFIGSLDPETVAVIDFQKEVIERIYSERVLLVVVDLRDARIEPLIPHLYNLIFSGVHFVDMHKLYEDIFSRVPLSLVRDNWFMENISTSARTLYDLLKRIMDVLVAAPLLVIPALCYPFLVLAMKLEDGGPVFIRQERIGQNNLPIRILKFRTMLFDDEGKARGSLNRVTRIGSFLRKSRLDEFPQLWNVLKGDLSVVGPRPELPTLAKQYSETIPYFNIRHLIKPGLSGWAQLYGEHAHHTSDVGKTRNKLSYDLYYLKNRSFMLDLKIALRTLKVLVSRSGI